MIGVVDYKTCNVGSILNMLKCIGAKARKISCAQDIDGIERLILPGVGAFDHAIRNIDSLGYRDRLISYALVEQRPILGICVGMQVMSDSSEEGSERGLGLFQAETKSIRARVDSNIKVPNMGWSSVSIKRAHPIFNGLENDARFYFVHSYFVDCHDNNDVLATKSYGIEFPVAICKKNILAVQFHPEKSHEFGKRLFRNFLEIEV